MPQARPPPALAAPPTLQQIQQAAQTPITTIQGQPVTVAALVQAIAWLLFPQLGTLLSKKILY
jgi:hypothetical protein